MHAMVHHVSSFGRHDPGHAASSSNALGLAEVYAWVFCLCVCVNERERERALAREVNGQAILCVCARARLRVCGSVGMRGHGAVSVQRVYRSTVQVIVVSITLPDTHQ